ncbi:hypothetical protein NDU88_005639 [Pleurodeles waltl]|uniref:Uncharacterized protein n=1 Tax=Pleurodeles waltl TaxID=8319 RepID=A0AAV7NS35_PLEWA|nr:hypothetical protein NDU88_005639 [Pleurodeles waltl]
MLPETKTDSLVRLWALQSIGIFGDEFQQVKVRISSRTIHAYTALRLALHMLGPPMIAQGVLRFSVIRSV